MKEEIRNQSKNEDFQTRRDFLQTAAAASAGLIFSPMISAGQESAEKVDDINVAVIGVGEQGQTLINACRNIPGIHFKAICDIWADHNRKRTARVLGFYDHIVNQYEDYKKMLSDEKTIDAVIIATPDFCHAEQAVACLEAGLHVYCEKEMSNTLEGARQMVQAAKQTGKLLQIGHQRRSNPKYIHCYEKLIKEAKLLGQITAVNGQWNRTMIKSLGWAAEVTIPQAVLSKYGYKSMEQFRNWRWYKGLGGGPIVDLGSHQIDVYNWFLESFPKNVFASGRTNYYDKKTHEWYDTVMAVYEYDTAHGAVTAFYQTINMNSRAGYYEAFLGNEGMLNISEAASPWNGIYREKWVSADKWEPWCKAGCIKEIEVEEEEETEESNQDEMSIPVHLTLPAPQYEILFTMDKPIHQPHLENFFDAIRGKAKLNCPAETGYETAVTVLKVNEAIEAGRRLEFKPEDFIV
ncbi:MAG: Gfo/Idh/MocA family oxidoreductase [Sedimentisphaerales bacterium]|nr:Gfo/Idh/MocA family oxidoreductase [Sedimentisphaerales bacterium]